MRGDWMNQFTKEELQNLNGGLSAWIGETNFYPAELPALQQKIQAMIDNYCEHDGEIYRDSMMVDICSECGKIK